MSEGFADTVRETTVASQSSSRRTIQTPINPALRIQQDPPAEIYRPHLEECRTRPTVWVIPPNSSEPQEIPIEVVRTNQPTHAYMRIPSMRTRSLDHHGPGWGVVYFGVRLRRVAENVYQAPKEDAAERVAIKRLRLSVVDASLAQGRKEDPYKEILRMQTLGDNIHVLQCIEALIDRDKDFLYIITPYCDDKSLAEWIPWHQGIAEDQARIIFTQILKNIQYLQDHGICHRDLSPDNCMVYQGRIVLTDLAMSFLIPNGGMTAPMGGFGKPAYLPPEVFLNLPFDATACDLWSAIVTLFNLLTGEILYEHPHPQDIFFRYFVLAKGCSSTPLNERTVEIIMGLDDDHPKRNDLWNKAQRCMSLSPEALELLEGVLRVATHERWNQNEVQSGRWMSPTM